MGSLVEELGRREAAAQAEAGRLRSRIEELSGELAEAEQHLARLVIAREEVTRVLEESAAGICRRGLPARPVGRRLRTPGRSCPDGSHGSAPVPCQREADPGARGDGTRRFPGRAEDFPG